MTAPLLEFELLDSAGSVYRLANDARHALEVSGLGMPPITHWTTRSPFQNGRTHWGYAFQPRVVTLTLSSRANGRGGLYEARRNNITLLSPESSPLRLRLRIPRDGLEYELREGWYQRGYELSSGDESYDLINVWNIAATVQIEFEDPFWKWTNSPLAAGHTRDSEGRTCRSTSAFVLTAQLVLPFTGPYLLGTTEGTATLTCDNAGSWETKPTITITGPTEDWVLTNATTGDTIYSDGYTLAAAEVLTIDVPNKTATSTVAGDMTSYLRGDTAAFSLTPGSNTLNFFSSGGAVNAVTTVAACWFVEVLGT